MNSSLPTPRVSVLSLGRFAESKPSERNKIVRNHIPKKNNPAREGWAPFYSIVHNTIKIYDPKLHDRNWLLKKAEEIKRIIKPTDHNNKKTKYKYNCNAIINFARSNLAKPGIRLHPIRSLPVNLFGLIITAPFDWEVVAPTRTQLIKVDYTKSPPSSYGINIINTLLSYAFQGKPLFEQTEIAYFNLSTNRPHLVSNDSLIGEENLRLICEDYISGWIRILNRRKG